MERYSQKSIIWQFDIYEFWRERYNITKEKSVCETQGYAPEMIFGGVFPVF